MESLLGGSLFFLYLFAIITVINFTEIDNKQKISVIYVLTYGIKISDAQISSKLLLWAFIVALFLYEEYWTSDGNRLKIIKSFIFKIMDFVMRMVFLYKILVYLVAIFLISSTGDKVVSGISQNFQIESDVILQIFRISSLILVFVAIHLMLIEPVELNSYDNIISKINKTPYYLMIEKECCENNIDDFIDRLSLLTDIEDRFFFCRQGYTILSFDYAKSYIREKLDEVVPEHCSIASGIYKFFMQIITRSGLGSLKRFVVFII